MDDWEIEQLRKRLMDRYGTAMTAHPAAVMDLVRAERMTDEEVIREAIRLGIIEQIEQE